MSKKKGYCEINGCRNKPDLIYYGHHICGKHWDEHCEGKINLKKTFEVKDETNNK